LGDIHGNYVALKTVLDYIDTLRVDAIFVTGDLVGYYPEPEKCVNDIKDRADYCVAGNHDKMMTVDNFAEELDYFNMYAQKSIKWTRDKLYADSEGNEQKAGIINYLKKLRFKEKAGLPHKKRVLITHGSPDDPYEYVFFPKDKNWKKKDHYRLFKNRLKEWLKNENVDLIILGHTHIPFVAKLGDKIVINPGSVGQPRDGDPRSSFAILRTDEKGYKLSIEIIRLKYAINTVIKQIKDNGLPVYLGKRLFKGQ